jgi:hypothetical protein
MAVAVTPSNTVIATTLLSRLPSPSPSCRYPRYCHAVHQRRHRHFAIAPSVAIALPSRRPLPSPSLLCRPSTSSPLHHHRCCTVHRHCHCTVHHHCRCGRPSTPWPSCHCSAFCGRCGVTLSRNGRCHCTIHHRHCHHLAVAPSIAVAVTPSITIVATALLVRHPLPLLQCRSLLAASPRCRRTLLYHHCCLSILLSVVVNSFPLLPHFLLVIIADLFRLIVVSIDRAYIGGNGSVFVHVPTNWLQWHRCCHCCSCHCAPLLFAGGAITARQHRQLASFRPYLDAQHSSPTFWEVVFTEFATDMNTKR